MSADSVPEYDREADNPVTPEEVAYNNFGYDLHALGDALGALDNVSLPDALDHLIAGNHLAELVETLRVLRAHRTHLARLEASVEAKTVQVARALQAREGECEDGTPWAINFGTTRKRWDHERIQSHIATAVLRPIEDHEIVDADTGEAVDVRGMIMAAVKPYGVAYYRTGDLKPLGINANDFCDHEPGRATVQITEADSKPTTTTQEG